MQDSIECNSKNIEEANKRLAKLDDEYNTLNKKSGGSPLKEKDNLILRKSMNTSSKKQMILERHGASQANLMISRIRDLSIELKFLQNDESDLLSQINKKDNTSQSILMHMKDASSTSKLLKGTDLRSISVEPFAFNKKFKDLSRKFEKKSTFLK